MFPSKRLFLGLPCKLGMAMSVNRQCTQLDNEL